VPARALPLAARAYGEPLDLWAPAEY
jgi:hypothetical protein